MRNLTLKYVIGLLSISVCLCSAESLVTQAPIKIMKKFDENSFSLAFDVFVEAKNLDAALEVAKFGINHSVHTALWLDKAAKISLWRSNPTDALKYYKGLFAQKKSQESADEIIRIASALNDSEGIIMGLEYTLINKAATKQDALRLLKLYEDAGSPDDALASMKKLYHATQNPIFLETAAELSDRAGNVETAFELYRQLERTHQLSPRAAMNLVSLYLRTGENEAAFDVMKKMQNDPIIQTSEYLSMYGELAWRLQENHEIEYAYNKMLETNEIKPYEFERLITIKGDVSKADAAKLAEYGYKKFKSEAMLMRSLNLYLAANEWGAMKTLLFDISKKEIAVLNQNSTFLVTKALFYLHEKMYRKAFHNLKMAESISNDKNTMELILLTLIEMGDRKNLAIYLRKYEPSMKYSQKYYLILANAYMTLSQHTKALRYYKAAFQNNKNEKQSVLDLAGIFEASQHHTFAYELRKSLWQSIFKNYRENQPLDFADAGVQNYLFNKRSPDTLYRLFNAQQHSLKSDLLNYTYLNHIGAVEEIQKMASRDTAAQKKVPAWAALPIHNEQLDLEAVERYLNSHEALPPYDEMEANTLLHRSHMTEELAFDRMTTIPNDDESHRRFSEKIFDKARLISGGFEYYDQTDMTIQRSYLSGTIKPFSSLSVGVELEKEHNTLSSKTLFKNDTYTNTNYTFIIGQEWSPQQNFSFELFKREALTDEAGLKITYDWTYDKDTILNLSGGINGSAMETSALLIGGAKDFLAVSATQKISKREYLKLDQEFGRIHTQKGQKLSSVSRTFLTLGHHAKTEYPDINTRIYYGINQYSHENLQSGDFSEWADIISSDYTTADITLDLLVPKSYDQYGVDLSWGESISGQKTYSKALRPYGTISLSSSTLFGESYSALGGFVTSLEGQDRFQGYISFGQGGQNGFQTGGINTGIGINYLLAF